MSWLTALCFIACLSDVSVAEGRCAPGERFACCLIFVFCAFNLVVLSVKHCVDKAMVSLVANYSKVSIEEEENSGLILEADPIGDAGEVDRCVCFFTVTWVVTDKSILPIAFLETMTMVWRPVRGVTIQELERLNFYFSSIMMEILAALSRAGLGLLIKI
ncbi:unnamed protein product [Cuscuta epithymum]|uniref:Secreted protein n=1 Tax=Cuscuta epithymum TaxID=186058 RepID=A0AAV0EZI5_9ASTE|nr:unnamed protein product [Cuscuta epithymum]